jgi:hypothetical protein
VTIIAAKMTKETDLERNAKQVQEKICQLEESFKNAHDFATSETGAGIQNEQGEESFKDLVKKRCPYYYELCDIMADRSSAQPKAKNDPHVLDAFSDEDDDDAEDIEATEGTEQSYTPPGKKSNEIIQDMSQVQEGEVKARSAVSSVASSNKGSKRRKKGSNPLMDDETATIQRQDKQVRHLSSSERVILT